MRHLAAWLFCTLDGVVEAPEQWVRYDERTDELVRGATASVDTLLLGRATYEVFASSWPDRTADDDPLAPWMNQTAKVVVSTRLSEPAWGPVTVIPGLAEVREMKAAQGGGMLVNGSPTLVRGLLGDGLLDALTLFLHPIVLGVGRRLFSDHVPRTDLRLASSTSLPTGVMALTYEPA